MRGQEQYIKEKPLEDGRLSFATDSKKIYLDCDYTDPHNNKYQDRISFGGNSGIYYGNRTFTTEEIEENDYSFNFPDDFDNSDEIPSVDDIIINTDGCFYRVLEIDENNYITVNKLTVAGGGGGGSSSGIIVARDPDQSYNIIAANNSIPIGFKVTDTLEDTHIDVEVTINDVYAGTFRDVIQNEFSTIELKSYKTFFTKNENNTIKLRFVNEYDHAAQLIYRNIKLIDLDLKIASFESVVKTPIATFNLQPYGIKSMYKKYYNIELTIPGYLTPEITKEEITDNTIDNGEILPVVINLPEIYDTYTAKFWISALPSEADTEELTSPLIIINFAYRDPNAQVPMLSFNLNQTVYTQYETATIVYQGIYNEGETQVELKAYCNNIEIKSTTASLIFNRQQEWSVALNNAGTYKFTIRMIDYNLEKSIENIEVRAAEIVPPTINTNDNALALYLSAEGRSNTEANPAVWNYKNINCTFENFNWNTNGWITDNDQVTSLHLTNGAKLTVPYAIFENDVTDPNGVGKAIEIVYKLSNIRDENAVFIKAASKYNNKIQTGIISTGSIISLNTRNNETYKIINTNTDGTNILERKHNGLQAYISADQRIHVAFSIQTKNTNNSNANFIYTYVDGVLSSLKQYDSNDHIQETANDPSYIIVDSTYGDIDIYSIRVYNKYIADSIVLNNYAADLPTLEQKMFIKTNNDVLIGGEINLNKVAELGNIPYLVVTDLREVEDKKASTGIIKEESRLTTGKKDFRWCPCYYVDPEDKNHLGDQNYIKRSFGSPTELVDAVMYGQGTSSMAFPVKNFRLRFKNKKDKYSLKPAVPVSNALEAEKWEALPKVALFTFKADYMDSSMSHNTGTGNALAALYDSIGLKTPAQNAYRNRTICTNVVGHPCLVFWRTGEIGTETFIGRYNFNTDKAEHELFGFFEDDDTNFGKLTDEQGNLKKGFQSTLDESKYWDGEWNEEKQEYTVEPLKNKTYYIAPDLNSPWQYNGIEDGGAAMELALKNGPLYEYVDGPRTIQCWEFLDNSSAYDNFRASWREEDHPDYASKTTWVTSFESRYPEHQETKFDQDPTKKYQYCTDFRAFSRLINWINSTNQMQATNELLNTPVIISGQQYDRDTKEYRLAKFKNELSQYMDIDFTIFYYIITEVLLMIDSRAKNMMMVAYDLDSDAGTGHWFPIFYDMDTILGVNNQGALVFSYSENDTNTRVYNAGANYGRYDENDNWIPNTEYSVLWCNLREGFQERIATIYQNLRSVGKLSVNYLLSCYNTKQSNAFAQIYSNQDGIYKYIRPLTEQSIVLDLDTGEEKPKTSDYLYVEQGTRQYHRLMFLTKRFGMLDSKYHYQAGESDIYMRVNGLTEKRTHPDPHPYQFTFTAQNYQYCSYILGRASSFTELQPGIPTLASMPIGEQDTTNNLETFIDNINSIYDIGDLSDKFLTNLEFKNVVPLRTLQIGNSHEDYHYETDQGFTIGGLDKVPLLESIDVSKIQFTTPTLNLSNNIYLNSVYAKGSNLTSITLAPGTNIKHLELPASLVTLKLKDFLFYDTINHPENLQIEDCAKLTTISIEKCPRVNSQSLIEMIMAQDHGTEKQLISIRLPDINWSINTINEDTCVLSTDDNITIIEDIKILDYATSTIEALSNLDQTINIRPGDINFEYFGGTITINNDNYFIDDLKIKNKYSARFPNLNFVYTNPNNIIAGYNINVYTAQNEINRADSLIKSHEEAIGFNLRSFLQNDVHIPSVLNSTSAQWTYEFKGWSYNGVVNSNDPVVIANALNTGVAVEYDENNNTYIVDINCPTALTENDYTNHELSLYPVFQMHLRKYNITFYKTEQNTSPEEVYTVIEQEYGSRIILPEILPVKLELDQNDKSISKIQYLETYVTFNGVNYDNILVGTNIDLYPIYSNEQLLMNNITNPPSYYFDTSTHKTVQMFDRTFIDDDGHEVEFFDTDNNTIEAIIKENVRAEAVCVPKKIDNKYVISIKNRSPYVKRIYFEPGSVIKYIGGSDTGFNGSQFVSVTPGTTGDKYRYEDGIYIPDENGTYIRMFKGFVENNVNTVLEYIDLKALTQLKVLGGNESQYTGEDAISRVFANCSNLDIQDLPDSLTIINPYTFFKDSNLTIKHMPKDLLCIGSYAFQQCTSLGEIIFGLDFDQNRINVYNQNSNLQAEWPIIGNSAFYQCTNLVFQTKNPQTGTIINDTSLTNITTIGTYAFYKCSNFVMTLSSIGNTSIKYIGENAFSDCTNLGITKIPQAEYIGPRAYQNIGVLSVLSAIPNTIKYIGEAVFNGDTLASNNGYNLIWNFYPSVALAETNDIIINAQALKGCNIQKLTFNFDTYSAADPADFVVIKEKMPWSTAYTNENYGFGAKVSKIQILVNNNYID